jgi:hypothetical protein
LLEILIIGAVSSAIYAMLAVGFTLLAIVLAWRIRVVGDGGGAPS